MGIVLCILNFSRILRQNVLKLLAEPVGIGVATELNSVNAVMFFGATSMALVQHVLLTSYFNNFNEQDLKKTTKKTIITSTKVLFIIGLFDQGCSGVIATYMMRY